MHFADREKKRKKYGIYCVQVKQKGRTGMKSCDLSLVSSKLNGLDYNEAVLCCGLNNMVNVMQYGGSSLYILQGRGICFIDELLERLKVGYRLLDAEMLFQKKTPDAKRLIMVLPAIDFEEITQMNPKVVQFFHTFGTYSVEWIDKEKVVLKGEYEEGTVKKVITREALCKLKQLSIKPLNVPYKIIYLTDEQVEKEQVRACIRDNFKELLASAEYMDEEGGFYKGSNFYRYVKDLLLEQWNGSFNRVSKYVFVQSIQNGSSFFYRREFNEALKQKYGKQEYDLLVVGNLWRKLSRYLKSTVTEGKEAEEKVIEALLGQIEKKERAVFKRLKEEF